MLCLSYSFSSITHSAPRYVSRWFDIRFYSPVSAPTLQLPSSCLVLAGKFAKKCHERTPRIEIFNATLQSSSNYLKKLGRSEAQWSKNMDNLSFRLTLKRVIRQKKIESSFILFCKVLFRSLSDVQQNPDNSNMR